MTTVTPVGTIGALLSNAVDTTPLALTVPAGVLDGDFLLVFAGILTTTPTLVTPAGWVQQTLLTVGSNHKVACYLRWASVSAPDGGGVQDTPGTTAYTFSSGGGRGEAVIFAFRNVDRGAPFGAIATAFDGTTGASAIPFPAITTTRDADYLLGLVFAHPTASGTQTTFVPPNDYAEDVDQCTTSTTTGNQALEVISGQQQTAGSISGLGTNASVTCFYGSFLVALQAPVGVASAGAAGLLSLFGVSTGTQSAGAAGDLELTGNANGVDPTSIPADDTGQGQGSVQTYVTGDVASATVDADMHLFGDAAPQDVLAYPSLFVRSIWFDIEDYLVLDGVPTGQAPFQARLRTRCGIGTYTYSDVPPAPAEVNINATARWLPSDASFISGEGWNPTTGSGFALTCNPVTTPYLDDSYSFQVRGGDEVSLPALIFTGDAWMAANDINWTANAFTVGLVAVLHANPEGPMYGLVESSHDPVDENDLDLDWGVRCTQGRIDLWSGAQVVSHIVQQQIARPVVILASIDAVAGRLLVADRQKSTRSFATGGIKAYDVQLYLGRTGGALAKDQTAEMDVLEFAYWDHALDFDEMANVLHEWDSCYGVTG